jgi:hypothetical protein
MFDMSVYNNRTKGPLEYLMTTPLDKMTEEGINHLLSLISGDLWIINLNIHILNDLLNGKSSWYDNKSLISSDVRIFMEINARDNICHMIYQLIGENIKSEYTKKSIPKSIWSISHFLTKNNRNYKHLPREDKYIIDIGSRTSKLVEKIKKSTAYKEFISLRHYLAHGTFEDSKKYTPIDFGQINNHFFENINFIFNELNSVLSYIDTQIYYYDVFLNNEPIYRSTMADIDRRKKENPYSANTYYYGEEKDVIPYDLYYHLKMGMSVDKDIMYLSTQHITLVEILTNIIHIYGNFRGKSREQYITNILKHLLVDYPKT